MFKFVDTDYILDTETTGLGVDDEIIEIALIDMNENVVFHSYLKPTKIISAESQAIHQIPPEKISRAPKITEVYEQLKDVMTGKNIVSYNNKFDDRLLLQTLTSHGLEIIDFNTKCAMLAYSSLRKEYNYRNGQFNAWVKLTVACLQQDINSDDLQAHNAIDDCIMTVRLIKAMLDTSNFVVSPDYLIHIKAEEKRLRYKKAYQRKIERIKSHLLPECLSYVGNGYEDLHGNTYPYFGQQKPENTVTLSKVKVGQLDKYKFAGGCCDAYGNQGWLFYYNA